jgi:hypothetical protein
MALTFALKVRYLVEFSGEHLFIGFFETEPTGPVQAECKIDQDCPYPRACYQDKCQDLCGARNPCEGNLICSVEETYAGSRIVVCSCPEGHVAVSPSYCESGKSVCLF